MLIASRQPEVTPSRVAEVGASLARDRDSWIALLALLGIGAHLWMRYAVSSPSTRSDAPLLVVLAVGGAPLVVRLVSRAVRGEFGADHLAAVSIVGLGRCSVSISPAAIVVLMLPAGNRSNSLRLRKRHPSCARWPDRSRRIAHRGADMARGRGRSATSPSATTYPSSLTRVCPVDGQVVAGPRDDGRVVSHGRAVPHREGPGTRVLSGAVNGDASLRVRATGVAADSRFAQIMRVMQDAEQRRPAASSDRRSAGRLVHPGRDDGRRRRVVGERRSAAVSQRGRDRDALSAADRDSGRDHRRDLHGRAAGRDRARSGGARAADPLPDDDSRQDRHAHLRTTGLSDELYAPPFAREAVLPMVAAMKHTAGIPWPAAIVRAAEDAGYATAGCRVDPRRARRRPARAGRRFDVC